MVTCSHFSFDPERRVVLAADGTVLHLTPKAFDLLRILIEEAPRVVRKDELHRRLWPATFVTDAALTSIVKELRRVLRDLPAGPFIKTTHGIGYAFDHACSHASTSRQGVHWLVGQRRRYFLKPGANVIGRDASADVRLDDVEVSRRHACIVVAGESAGIEDLGSKNGTAVGDSWLAARCQLGDGARIRIGPVTFTYRLDQSVQSTATAVAQDAAQPSSGPAIAYTRDG